MPRYMIQASYTAEALATFAKAPQDREAPLRGLLQKLEGKLISLDYCFGDYDVVAIGELPDDSAAIAAVLAANLPGHLRALKTTKLFTQAEMNEASRKAGRLSYEGPSPSS